MNVIPMYESFQWFCQIIDYGSFIDSAFSNAEIRINK